MIDDLEKRQAWLAFASAVLSAGSSSKSKARGQKAHDDRLDALIEDALDVADEMLEEYLVKFEARVRSGECRERGGAEDSMRFVSVALVAPVVLVFLVASCAPHPRRMPPPSCTELRGPWPPGTWWVCEAEK